MEEWFIFSYAKPRKTSKTTRKTLFVLLFYFFFYFLVLTYCEGSPNLVRALIKPGCESLSKAMGWASPRREGGGAGRSVQTFPEFSAKHVSDH